MISLLSLHAGIRSYPEKLISIIIPTLNEQDGIEKTIQSIPKKRLLELGYSIEIIIVDGNSTDSTREIAERMGTRVIVEKRRGYGRAFKTGFSEAKGDILVTLDADLTYPAELIPEYIQTLNEKGVDFISANRFSKIQNGAMDTYHRFGNNILSLVMRILYSIKVRDSQSGMWVMSREFAKRINIVSDGFSMSEEIKIIAFTFFKALELNGLYNRRVGNVKLATFGDGWRNLKFLFRYRFLIKDAVKSPVDLVQKGIDINADPYMIDGDISK
jgi:glycosyltransferase involved in cell wall biosynthesis